MSVFDFACDPRFESLALPPIEVWYVVENRLLIANSKTTTPECRSAVSTCAATVASDFDVQTAVERELVLRLASLLWRLRRATAIDTGLLQIFSDIGEDSDPKIPKHADEASVEGVVRIGQFSPDLHDRENHQSAGQYDLTLCSDISRRFLRLHPGAVERLGRYETTLWRQVYQVIFVLDYLRRQNLDLKWLPRSLSYNGRMRRPSAIFPRT